MEEELRFKIAYRYLEYRRLVDRYEFIERIMPDYDVFQNVYCILSFPKYRIRIIEEIKTNYNFYLYLYKESNSKEFKCIYEKAEELLCLCSKLEREIQKTVKKEMKKKWVLLIFKMI